MKGLQWLPFPPAMAKECEALCNVFFGSHKPTTVSGFPPETVLQPRTGLRYTHRSVQRLKYSCFCWERKSTKLIPDSTKTPPKKLSSNKDPKCKVVCNHLFFGLPNIFSSTTLTLGSVSTLPLEVPPRMMKLTRPAKVCLNNGSR